jgi:hypothetical protein
LKVDQLAPRVANRVRFSLREQKLVPSAPGCYALVSLDEEVLYLGLTNNLSRRLAEHCESRVKRAPVNGRKAMWFHYVPVEKLKLGRVERGWMNQYLQLHGRLPPLNRVFSPVG